jgi:hypothetical protein
MSSPIKFDDKFVLPHYSTNKFIPLGQQRGNKGITHTLFLGKQPIHASFFVGEPVTITGYCSYRLLFNNNESLLTGVLFLSPSAQTVVSDYTLSVGNNPAALPEHFEPSFILENSGILVFKGSDSSILAIPSEVDSSLLIKTE